jgi:hypothetical protein
MNERRPETERAVGLQAEPYDFAKHVESLGRRRHMNERRPETERAVGLQAEPYDFAKHVETVKVQLNTLIWMYGPPTMTLGEADQLACKMLEAMHAACTR